jgi:hypothetical protein
MKKVVGTSFAVQNPPWVVSVSAGDTGHQLCWPSEDHKVLLDTNISLEKALKTKLGTVAQTAQCGELKRAALLAAHDCGHSLIAWVEVPSPQLYDAYGLPIKSVGSPYQPAFVGMISDVAFKEFKILFDEGHYSASYRIAQLFLLHLFSFLLDGIETFWEEVATERLARLWALILSAFRHQLRCGLFVKCLSTPLRLTRRSIHPIEEAA